MSPYQQHYLVTGGAGFIGNHLIRELLKDEKIRLTVIDNFDAFYPRQYRMINTEGFEKFQRILMLDRNLDDLTAFELQKILPQKVDVIIHLAAKSGGRTSIGHALSFQRTNVLGTQMLLDFARANGVRQFVFASSGSVYGNSPGRPWNEAHPVQPLSPFAMTKAAGESAGYVSSSLYGIRFVSLRLFSVYGPSQRPDQAIHRFLKAMLRDEPLTVFGDGTSSRDYIYVDDVVQGILAAIRYDRSPFEIINLGSRRAVSLNELVHALETATGKTARIDRQDVPAGEALHTLADIAKAERLLGFVPATALDAGLQRFRDWFLMNQDVLMHGT